MNYDYRILELQAICNSFNSWVSGLFSEGVGKSEAVPRRARERPCSLVARGIGLPLALKPCGFFLCFEEKLTITDRDQSVYL